VSEYTQPPTRNITPKDPDTAFLIELIGTFFGLLGLGYIYVGRTQEGLIRLIIWIVYNSIAWITIFILISLVIGCFCIPIQRAIQIGVAIWSATTLKNSVLA
jgi:TM2 domain-containing membrane protein YozV